MSMYIKWAFIVEILYMLFYTVLLFLQDALLSSILVMVILIASVAIVMNLLLRDAKSRKLSTAHALWALIGIVGVIVYYFAFAKTNPQA